MAGIYPIPTGRVSDILVQRRMTSQLQEKERTLLRIQQQLSTGIRLTAPSDDPSAAVLGMELQRLLEQKQQYGVNIQTTQSYLSATDNALSAVGQLLAEVRGLALTMVDNTTSATERQAASQQVEAALRQLIDMGNEKFRGRYLFSGSTTDVRPFETEDGYVVYHGNARTLRSYGDHDLLVDTNVSGEELFGAVSAQVRGQVDLNPRLTADTRLADLRQGQGIPRGSFVISDGTNSSVIDISSAETIGDVAALIESNPPAGRQLAVSITDTGLTISLDAAGGGNLTITEISNGTTARDLGILEKNGSGTGLKVGDDLDPVLRLTTRISDLQAPLDLASGVQIVNGDHTYVVDVSSAQTVEELLNLLNGSPAHVLAEVNAAGTGIDLRSRLSGSDFQIGENGGTTATDLGVRSLTADTLLADLNYGRGVQTVDGPDFVIHRGDGVDLPIDIESAATVGDVLRLINDDPANQDPATRVTAQLATQGNGIELVNDNPAAGQQLTVLCGGPSQTAWDLGLVPLLADQSGPTTPAQPATARLAFSPPNDINTGLAVTANQPGTAWNGIDIEFRNTLTGDVAVASLVGNRLYVDLDVTQTTANTVLAAINDEGTFTATLDTASDPTNDGSGLVATAGVVGTTAGGTPDVLTATDVGSLETHSVFNTLIRLNRAILDGDVTEIGRLTVALDADLDQLTFGRAAVGARSQGVGILQDRHAQENTFLHSALSDQVDTDFAAAASALSAQQVSYQAALQATARAFQLTLLDYL